MATAGQSISIGPNSACFAVEAMALGQDWCSLSCNAIACLYADPAVCVVMSIMPGVISAALPIATIRPNLPPSAGPCMPLPPMTSASALREITFESVEYGIMAELQMQWRCQVCLSSRVRTTHRETYAVDCEVIAKAPKIGLFKIERLEIVAAVRMS